MDAIVEASALSRRLRRLSTLGLLTATLGVSHDAAAFCRSTTCNPRTEACPRDDSGCLTTGAPLYWASRCLFFVVHEAGAPKQNISHDDTVRVAQQAFVSWMQADCGGVHPSFRVWDATQSYGPAECGHPEYNACAPNANVILFREDEWPYEGAANVLAYTDVTYVATTGEILDADIEINAATTRLTVADGAVEDDLASILTHEAGHFFGLDHSNVSDATMVSEASPGATFMRSLEQDDVDAICTVYPPDRDAPECSSPRTIHGYTRQCVQTAEEAESASSDKGPRLCVEERGEPGCTCSSAAHAGTPTSLWVGSGLVALSVLRRRRPRKTA